MVSFSVNGLHFKGDVGEGEGVKTPGANGEDVAKRWCGELCGWCMGVACGWCMGVACGWCMGVACGCGAWMCDAVQCVDTMTHSRSQSVVCLLSGRHRSSGWGTPAQTPDPCNVMSGDVR